MRSAFVTTVLSFLSYVFLVTAFPNPGYVTGNISVHDPSICRDSKGTYFLFSTGVNIPISTSTDRINWTAAGTVWDSKQANWAEPFTGGQDKDLWAPDCTYRNGEFYLYYAASQSGKFHSAIFFAKSTTGRPKSWVHQGMVLSTEEGNTYNAIDPSLVITEKTQNKKSEWWMVFGSFRGGIKLVQLDPGTGKPINSDPDSYHSLAKRTAGGGAIEAPIIIQRGAYFYLITSWDTCCSGTSSTYNIRVGRSKDGITGPYKDRAGVPLLSGGGTLILGTHKDIIGPGGQHLFLDVDDWIIDYHYYTKDGSKLGINKVGFPNDWPLVY